MADNVPITAGSGTTIAADEVTDATLGSCKMQYIKVADGTLDSTNKLIVSSAGAAKVDGSAVTQPVSIATAPVLVAGSAIIGKVGIDQTTPGTTNAASLSHIGSTTVASGNGVVGAGVQRVAIASDNTAFSVNVGTINGQSIAYGTGARGATVQRVTVATDDVLPVGGQAAENASPVGNPVYVAGHALVGANPTKATNGQVSCLATDAIGRQIFTLNHERTMTGIQQTTITSSTSETTIVTAVASTFLDLTNLTITNSSATATIVTLKDSTAGTTRGIYSIAAGGGIVIPFNTPLAQATVNNNWTLTCGTSVASIYVVAQFVKNT